MKETKPRRKWTAHEIVDGETRAITETTVSDALQAAADAPLQPDPQEVIDAQPAITLTVRIEPQRVERIEQARALVEIAKGEPSDPVAEGIQSFKDTDRRTMLVVVVDGALFKQQAPERESA